MGARNSQGFTIIETMLFLAVTGLLVMGVLIGTGTALNRQRYRDSVESFKNVLQSQYADLGSVRNSRPDTLACDATALPVPGSEIRGQSGCLIVGKYLRIDGGDISIYTVLARGQGITGVSDITNLDTKYTYNVSQDVEERTLEWGTKIVYPKSGIDASASTSRQIGILIIRSPDSGSLYTFTNRAVPAKTAINSATFTSLISASISGYPGQGARTLCVQSSGLFPTTDMAVAINQYAATASAIEVQSAEYMQSTEYTNAHAGTATKC
jgi:type II secretory pathway pseudopilin PulG